MVKKELKYLGYNSYFCCKFLELLEIFITALAQKYDFLEFETRVLYFKNIE